MRKVKSNNIPILILQGDIDVNTPYENAAYLLPYFKNTQIITLKNAAHQGRVHLFEEYPESLENIMTLFNADFNKTSFKKFSKTIRTEYDLKEIEFWDIGGKSIYEMRTSN